jgi:hypothetical protein
VGQSKAGQTRVIPPGAEHQVEPIGEVRCWIEFSAVDRSAATDEARPLDDDAGDPACWAGLLCAQCGAVMDGGAHKVGCPGE